jgi:uncharacterized membrane protein YkgB
MVWPARKRNAGSRPPLYEGDDHGFTAAPALSASVAVGGGSVRRSPGATATAVSEAAAVQAPPLWNVDRIALLATELAKTWFVPVARISIFVIYFWFGLLKLIGLSPATPLASALVNHTIGAQYFGASFKGLAIYECAVGILFLIPAATMLAAGLLAIHMVIVSSPLVLVAQDAWTHPLVPTFEGQYIIKDLALIALAIGILANTRSRGAAGKTVY